MFSPLPTDYATLILQQINLHLRLNRDLEALIYMSPTLPAFEYDLLNHYWTDLVILIGLSSRVLHRLETNSSFIVNFTKQHVRESHIG